MLIILYYIYSHVFQCHKEMISFKVCIFPRNAADSSLMTLSWVSELHLRLVYVSGKVHQYSFIARVLATVGADFAKSIFLM